MIDIVYCNVYKGQGVLSTELTEECRCHNRFYHHNLLFFMNMFFFQEGSFLEIKLKLNQFRPMDTNTFHTILHAQVDLPLGEQRYAKNNHENSLLVLFVNKWCLLSRLHSVCVLVSCSSA